MRQVGRDELIYVFAAALRRVQPATWRAFMDRRREVSDSGRVSVATTIAEALSRHEVLSSAPEANTPFGPALDRMWGAEVGPPRLKQGDDE